MAREHRILDGQTGELTIVPFTVEEEAIADQQDADRLAAETLFNTDDSRLDRAFTLDDKDRVIFKTLFEMINRVIALEGGVALTATQFKAFLKSKLP